MSIHDHLPRYRCHKLVRAAFITKVGTEVKQGLNGTCRALTLAVDGKEMTVDCPVSMFTRYEPKVDDVYVVYANDYASISPRAEFDAGYSRL